MVNPLPSLPFRNAESKSWLWVVIALLIFATAFRVVRAAVFPDLPNFSPLMAIAFCGAWFFPGALAVAIPVAALVVSDLAMSVVFGVAPGAGDGIRYACYLGAAGIGWMLWKRGTGWLGLVLGVIGSGIGFYLITNTVAWLGSPLYAQSFAGWLQALTVGIPGYPPTWMFFRNSLASDLLFTAILLVAAVVARVPLRAPTVA